jgi:hypothetical protein
MKYRVSDVVLPLILRYQNQVALLTWDKSMGYLCYCVGGIRHGSRVSLIQAFVWNLGTYRGMALVSFYRGGVIRSSDEVGEILWSKGITLISFIHESTNMGGVHDCSKTI